MFRIVGDLHGLLRGGSIVQLLGLPDANVDINGVFAIRGVKVIRGEKGPFVAMPQYKDSHGWACPSDCS